MGKFAELVDMCNKKYETLEEYQNVFSKVQKEYPTLPDDEKSIISELLEPIAMAIEWWDA